MISILNDSLENKLKKYGNNYIHNIKVIEKQYVNATSEIIRSGYKEMFYSILKDMKKYKVEEQIINKCKYNFEQLKTKENPR